MMSRKTLYQIVLIGLLLLAALLRSVNLQNSPPGITNDEMGYFYNAYSIAETGKDIYGKPFPLMFTIDKWPFMPVPTYILASVLRIFGLSVYSARLPNIFFGVGAIWLVWYLVKRLFHDDRLALLSAFVLTVSPWHIHFSRTGYDGVYAAFFYLAAVALLVRQAQENRTFLVSLPLFALAVASHRALSAIAIPILLLTAWYVWPRKTLKTRRIIEVICIVFAIVFVFAFLFAANNSLNKSNYIQEVSVFNNQKIQEGVDGELKQSDASMWVRRIFNNKATYVLRVLREQYLHVFSPQFLFTSGEADGIYNIWWRGQLYLIELPFLLLGFLYLFRRSKSAAGFVLLSILIAPIPAAISSPIYSMRSFYMVYFLPIVIAGGILWVGIRAPTPRRRVIYLIIGVAYVFSLASYLYQYHYRYTTYGAERWMKHEKDMVLFAADKAKTYDRVIISRASTPTLLQYAFYIGLDPRQVQQALVSRTNDTIILGNIMMTAYCFHAEEDPSQFINPGMLYITKDTCHPESKPSGVLYLPKSVQYIWKYYDGRDLLNLRSDMAK